MKTNNMEKKMSNEQKKRFIQEEVKYVLDWEDSVSVEQVRKDLDSIEKLGATHIIINPNSAHGYDTVEFIVVSERMETDEEFSERLKADEYLKTQFEKRERELLEQLKKKYE